jgi:glycosyltransferase involved in cell wall biosynthesis
MEISDYRDSKRVAVLSPVAWRTPPSGYGAWETVASNITEGLVARGWDVTLFATADSITKAKLEAVIEKGYEVDKSLDPKVVECLHISEVMERAGEFDLIHNSYDFLPLTYSRLIGTPMLTTIHGFSSPKILRVYRKYKESNFVSISDSDRDIELDYLATVYNGIDTGQITYREDGGDKLVFLGRIHPDKGVHLACEAAKLCGDELLIAGIIQDEDYFNRKVGPYIDDGQIRYVGPVDVAGKDELFGEARCLLHLNELPERFGLVMAEAMAAGVPVIAMDRGSCREVIEDGVTGFLVRDAKDAAEMVGRIGEIERQACRDRVEEKFTVDAMVGNYEKVYKMIFDKER